MVVVISSIIGVKEMEDKRKIALHQFSNGEETAYLLLNAERNTHQLHVYTGSDANYPAMANI